MQSVDRKCEFTTEEQFIPLDRREDRTVCCSSSSRTHEIPIFHFCNLAAQKKKKKKISQLAICIRIFVARACMDALFVHFRQDLFFTFLSHLFMHSQCSVCLSFGKAHRFTPTWQHLTYCRFLNSRFVGVCVLKVLLHTKKWCCQCTILSHQLIRSSTLIDPGD